MLLAGPARAQCVVQAVTQNVMVSPGPNGTVTVPASAVNNGSVASGGGLSLTPNTFGCPAPVPNYALTFTYSVAKYVQGTHPLLPQGNAPRTPECWVYVTAANANSSLFNYGVATDNHRSGILLIAGKFYYVGEFDDVSDTQNLPLNAWHHVAATYDGTTVRLYVDGALRVAARPPSPAFFATTGTTWRIAKRMDPKLDEYLDGSLDEVRGWNRALTAAELATSATRTNPASLAGLIANWNMNEGTGGTLRGITGNSPAGTLYNGPVRTQPGLAYNGQPATLTVTDLTGNVSRALPPENPVLTLPLASVADDNAQVTLGFAATGSTAPLRVLRRVASQGCFAVVGTVPATATTFTDAGLDAAAATYEYRLEVPTSCGPAASSAVAQTIRLEARATPGTGGPDQGPTDLRWNAYAGFAVAEYRLLRSLDGGPWVLLATRPGPTLQAAVPNAGAVPATGAGASQALWVVAVGPGSPALLANSNTAAVRFANPLRFYNLITPNGDGRNDQLTIDNLHFYPGSTPRVFDRWGRPVYAATDYRNTWGDAPDVAPGLYYYVLTVPDTPAFKGWVEVLK